MLPVNGMSSRKIQFGRNAEPQPSRPQNLRNKMLWLGLMTAAPMVPALMPSTAHAAQTDRVQIAATRPNLSDMDWEDLRRQRRQGGFRTVDAAILHDIRRSEAEYIVKPGDTLYDVAEAMKKQWGAEFDKTSINRMVAVLKRQNHVANPLRLQPGTRIDLKLAREFFHPGITTPAPEAPTQPAPGGTDAPPDVTPAPSGDVTPAPGGDVTPAPGGEVVPPIPGDEVTPQPPGGETPTPIPVPGGGETLPPVEGGGTVTPAPNAGGTQIEQTAPKPGDQVQQQAPAKQNKGILYGLLLAMAGVLASVVGIIVRGLTRGAKVVDKSVETPVKPEPPTGSPQPPLSPEPSKGPSDSGKSEPPTTEMKAATPIDPPAGTAQPEANAAPEETLPPAPPEVSTDVPAELPPATPSEIATEVPTDVAPEAPSELPPETPENPGEPK